MNKVTEKRFRNSRFYKAVIPEELRRFITKDEFYSHLPAIITEAYLEGVPITSLQRKITHARFVLDMTATEIQNKLNIHSSLYNSEMKSFTQIMNQYYELNVRPYPVRIMILKTKNLNHKVPLKNLYRIVPREKITLISFIKYFNNELRSKKSGYSELIDIIVENTGKKFSIKKEEETKILFNKLYALTVSFCTHDSFLRLVTTCEKTRKTTIINNITRTEEYISRNNIKINI